MWSLVMLVGGLTLLVFAGNLVISAAQLVGDALGFDPAVTGLTLVAMATSAPEMAVVLQSVTLGDADIATGSVVGSNIANILLVVGLATTIRAVHVGPAMRWFDTPGMAAASVLTWVVAGDGRISWVDGVIMLVTLAAYVWAMLRRRSQPQPSAVEESAGLAPAPLGRTVVRLVVGATLLAVAARLVVAGAEELAAAAGVSELVIGLTVVSIGTSVPEIVTSLVAAVRRQHGIAIGNAVGSNIVNLLLVLGLAGVVSRGGVAVADEALRSDLADHGGGRGRLRAHRGCPGWRPAPRRGRLPWWLRGVRGFAGGVGVTVRARSVEA